MDTFFHLLVLYLLAMPPRHESGAETQVLTAVPQAPLEVKSFKPVAVDFVDRVDAETAAEKAEKSAESPASAEAASVEDVKNTLSGAEQAASAVSARLGEVGALAQGGGVSPETAAAAQALQGEQAAAQAELATLTEQIRQFEAGESAANEGSALSVEERPSGEYPVAGASEVPSEQPDRMEALNAQLDEAYKNEDHSEIDRIQAEMLALHEADGPVQVSAESAQVMKEEAEVHTSIESLNKELDAAYAAYASNTDDKDAMNQINRIQEAMLQEYDKVSVQRGAEAQMPFPEDDAKKKHAEVLGVRAEEGRKKIAEEAREKMQAQLTELSKESDALQGEIDQNRPDLARQAQEGIKAVESDIADSQKELVDARPRLKEAEAAIKKLEQDQAAAMETIRANGGGRKAEEALAKARQELASFKEERVGGSSLYPDVDGLTRQEISSGVGTKKIQAEIASLQEQQAQHGATKPGGLRAFFSGLKSIFSPKPSVTDQWKQAGQELASRAQSAQSRLLSTGELEQRLGKAKQDLEQKKNRADEDARNAIAVDSAALSLKDAEFAPKIREAYDSAARVKRVVLDAESDLQTANESLKKTREELPSLFAQDTKRAVRWNELTQQRNKVVKKMNALRAEMVKAAEAAALDRAA